MRGLAFNGIFVTGTDTGIGKSVASAALLHAMRARGLRAVGMKPVASGCAETAARAIEADGLRLVGWIGNAVDPDMGRHDEVVALLARRLPAPCWGCLPHSETPDPAALARHLTFPD